MNPSHHEALETKHAALERRIHDEQVRPAPDDIALRRLKSEKLRIKEELSQERL